MARYSAAIRSFAIEELLATKLRALYQRRKGRDLFDLGIALRQAAPGTTKLVTFFEQYMARGGAAASRARFEENLTKKLAQADFTADLAQILSRAALAEFDRDTAGEQVLNELVARLEGEPWQGRTGRTEIDHGP